MYMLNSVMVVF